VLQRLLDRHPGQSTESELEGRVWRLLREAGLPEPRRQYEVRDRRRFVARLDFAYPSQMLAIEADGYRFHSSAKDWARERVRQNELVKLGWTIYRITWDDVIRRGQRIRDDIAMLLARLPSRRRPSDRLPER
jgi:very-short-patch-repair endonuclease